MKARFKFRVERRAQKREVVVEEPGEQDVEPVEPAPSPLAMRLALAHYVERCLEAGIIGSYAEAARKLGVTRARMAQIVDLAHMPAGDQERLLLARDHATVGLVQLYRTFRPLRCEKGKSPSR